MFHVWWRGGEQKAGKAVKMKSSTEQYRSLGCSGRRAPHASLPCHPSPEGFRTIVSFQEDFIRSDQLPFNSQFCHHPTFKDGAKLWQFHTSFQPVRLSSFLEGTLVGWLFAMVCNHLGKPSIKNSFLALSFIALSSKLCWEEMKTEKAEINLHVMATGTMVPLVMWCSISSPYYQHIKLHQNLDLDIHHKTQNLEWPPKYVE